MSYKSLEEALIDLKTVGMLLTISEEVDPYLEMASIARLAYEKQAPAILFEKVKGSPFRAACNIFGTVERAEFLFRKEWKTLETAIAAKANPLSVFKTPQNIPLLPFAGLQANPLRSFGAPVLQEECTLSDLPQLHSWKDDGGAFITLPQVCSLDPTQSSILKANLGMYRIQISGNDYVQNKECGLHYQINRDIARHHQNAIAQKKPLKVSIFIGGPPAHTLAAVMPMPENLSELIIAGLLNGRAFRYSMHEGWVVSTDADFCILGEIENHLKPEGPFGDHLGYYSAKHDFPFLKIAKVFHKKNAIFPFTVVGRPPQEDTVFGHLIHKITAPMVPASIPGLQEMHAVDAAGVHPLLLAIASERYVPYRAPEPMEILKTANAILGFNQAALAKYLFIAAREDDPSLTTKDIPSFFSHMLSRIDFSRDLHFQTSTTIDTLDYSGTSLNHGSKLVLAAAGKHIRELGNGEGEVFQSFPLIDGFSNLRYMMPGVLVLEGTPSASMEALAKALESWNHQGLYPWITVADDASFTSKNIENWLWVTFTRSDPAQDVYGVRHHIHYKHYACECPILIDARHKPHHQKPLIVDSEIENRAEAKLLKALKRG